MIANDLAGLRRLLLGTATVALMSTLALSVLCVSASRADVNTFTLVQPLNNATVRENVPIRVPRAMLNQASYATVTIDGQFRAAPAVPADGNVIYRWDTKNLFTTQAQPAVQQTTTDGSHTVQVALFDRDSDEIAQASSTVHVANEISSLPDGVHLVYKWHMNELLDYKLNDDVSRTDQAQDASDPAVGATDASSTSDQLQSVDITFERSVEDISGDQILLRDHILDNGTIAGGAQGAASAGGGVTVQSAFNLASKYWTVDKLGDLLTDNKPIASGDHLGFPILQLPPRRVNVGDSWQTDILASLQFSDEHLSVLHGQARLDSFEWQDGYPTAKIIETYHGPAKFTVGGQTASLPPIQANSVDLTRTVWFAYEAGIVVKSITTMDSDSQIGSDQLAALGSLGGSMSPETYAGVPQGQGPPPGAFPPGFMPGSPYTGRYMGNTNPLVSQSVQQTQLSDIKLKSKETIDLSSIGSS